MTGSFEVNGDKTTVVFEYTADTTKVAEILGKVAYVLYVKRGYLNDGQISFDDLTNQQMLDMIDSYLRDVFIDIANKQKVAEAEEAAREEALANPYAFD